MYDIVFPKNNEEEFIKLAGLLGYSGLCLLYGFEDFKKKKEKSYPTHLEIISGIVCQPNDVQKAKFMAEQVFVDCSDVADKRKLFEACRPYAVFNLENHKEGDKIHYRNSGIDHILCRIAAKNSIAIGFSFSTLLNGDRAKLLARYEQNIKFCRKYQIKTIIGSFASDPQEMRNPKDLVALFLTLGMCIFKGKKAMLFIK